MGDAFRHVDSAATIVFGPGAVTDATDLLGDGYTLLTTPRATAAAAAVAERAAVVVHVPPGPVDAVAAELRAAVTGRRLVALGGGRVIDVAKALAAADAPREVVAVPTSLSGAEMTGVHRHARGVPDGTPRARAAAVINDPALSASQPVEQLAASSANALGHAVTALASTRSTPIARSVASDAIARLTGGWAGVEPDRSQIALGALLAGWAVDRSGLGPHHVLSQTAVRIASLDHAHTNAALLPHMVHALRKRVPEVLTRLDALLGTRLEDVAERLRSRASAVGLGAIGTDDGLLERTVEAAARRPELERVPPAMTASEIREIYRSATLCPSRTGGAAW